MIKATGILAIVLFLHLAQAGSVASEEMAQARRWVAAKFEAVSEAKAPEPGSPVIGQHAPGPFQKNKKLGLGNLPALPGPSRGAYNADPPFSFRYGGKPSAQLLKGWDLKRNQRELDAQRTEHTLTYTDSPTGLVVRCVAIEYHDYPTVEWTLYFKNNGSIDTPILSDIQALDIRLERGSEGEFVLHHQTGSQMVQSEYQPFETVLGPGSEKQFIAEGGRPSSSYLPYFNIEWPGAGVIVVIGWPGQWSARFTRERDPVIRVQGGQQLTHFKMHPGEELRSSLIVLQFWEGDRIHSQNVWRRWMIAHNLPQPGGKLPPPLSTPCSSHQYWEMQGANEENQKMFIDRYIEEGLKPDYWWMDAGWYVNVGHWANTGTWEVDTNRFPRGLRAISDHAHSRGVKTLAWFEPERVSAGTWLAQNHPEWILGGTNGGLLNLGNQAARQWVIEHFDTLITEQGLDLYRQDFNLDPSGAWRANDGVDRQGVTEIKHVMGYLAFWDELRRRHPDMLIDSCAQGGRRNDLETLRRAVPLIRSDYLFEPVGQQCHMYGLSFWMPYHGTGVRSAAGEETEPYIFRSSMSIHLTPCWDLRRKDAPTAFNLAVTPPRDVDLVRRLMSQWRRVAPNYYGDYYPLTTYSLSNNVWMAWQFDRPQIGEGMVQAFRRTDNGDRTRVFKLRGLDPRACYRVQDLDESAAQELTGRELMERGLPISVPKQPGAALITYKKGLSESTCAPLPAQPTSREMEIAGNWVISNLSARVAQPPFSFVYGGKPFGDLLRGWNIKQATNDLDGFRTERTLTYLDPVTGLSVRLISVWYADFPAVEWVVYFKNTGSVDTPILENLLALNCNFSTELGAGEFTLNYNHGCNQLVTDFKPEITRLTNGSNVRMASAGGRSSSALSSGGVMPYFNIEKPDGSGIILAIGWSGQWEATFNRIDVDVIHIQAGMERTHLKLHPGEEVRTPSMVMLLWSGGDKIRGHNQWRRLILDHYSPTPGGRKVSPPIAASPHGTISFTASSETNMIQGITHCATHHLPIDTWWIDAGWYASWNMPGVAPWNTVGTWEPDPARYPNGLKPVADTAHARGFKFLLWFEVERAVAGSWVANHHPEWLLQPSSLPSDLAYQEQFQLVNFGNPAALAWAKHKFSRMVREVGIDVYRIDLNLDPLFYWQNNEPSDRQGINEIKHLMGWYDYLDTLVRENMHLMIDNCAGGGRRLDIEMVKRSVSLTPSDYLWDPIGQQAMNYGLSLWFPWHGVGSITVDPYKCRSGMLASFVFAFDLYNASTVWIPASAMLNQYKSIRQYYSGDFYPLSPYTVDPGAWMAWQFDRPEIAEGLIQAFRRADNGDCTRVFKLRGLDPKARYKVQDLDQTTAQELTGRELMDPGLPITRAEKPAAVVITYRKITQLDFD